MQSYRTLSTRLPVVTKHLIYKPTTRNMSFFPRTFLTPEASSSFTPLFRLLDDYESYNRHAPAGRPTSQHLKTFTPKFDVKELPEAYELHGELPGIDQKDVEIEFTDAQTLTVRGRTEREYTSGTPPRALEAQGSSGAITEGEHDETAAKQHNNHQPTVEDDDAEPSTAGETTVAKNDNAQNKQVGQQQKPTEQPEAKYWVSERAIGSFARSFTFPNRVDQDAVKASMKNGILSVIVPKAKKHEVRRVQIQ